MAEYATIRSQQRMTPPETGGEIEFTPEAVKEHLDGLIEYWRNKRTAAGAVTEDYWVAAANVDCLQTVRRNLFGEIKK